MAFVDDNGGFAFSCNDAKMSMCASTWSTRLSQLGRVVGPVYVMTKTLPDLDYIAGIIGKRPSDIFIIANSCALREAQQLKVRFPMVRIAHHPETNVKVVLVAPKTVWVSSEDFGRTDQLQSGVGLHSALVFQKTKESVFDKLWEKAVEVF